MRPEVAQDAAFKNLVEPLPRVSSFQPAVGSMALKGIGPRPTAPVRASAGCGQQEPGRRGRLDWGCALPAWSRLGWEPPLLPVCHSGCIPEHGAGRRVTQDPLAMCHVGAPRQLPGRRLCGCLLGWLLLASLRRRLTASSDWWAAAQRVQAVGREALWACVPVCEAVCLCEVWGA